MFNTFQRKISKVLRVGKAFVYKVLKMYRETGDVGRDKATGQQGKQ